MTKATGPRARKEAKLTAERLREHLSYDPATGLFHWLRPTNCRILVGSVAGDIDCRGYHRVGMFGERYAGHRLAWLYVHGEWPADEIDHINGITTDNRRANLRHARRQDNCHNQKKPKCNTSGVMGVHWHIGDRRYHATIKVCNVRIHIGSFSTLEKAAVARKQAERKYGFHPNHGRPDPMAGIDPQDVEA